MKQMFQKVSRRGYEAALRAHANVATARMMVPATARKAMRREEGATMVEYAILVALIAVAVILVVFTLGQQIRIGFNAVVNCLQDPSSANCQSPFGGG